MSNWLDSAVTRGQAVSDWLSPKRSESLELLKAASWPTRKTEAWKYVPINVWDRADLQAANSEAPVFDAIAGLDSIDLVFVDGQLRSSAVGDLPAGLSVTSIAAASEADQAWAKETFTSVKPARHLFGLVNDVLATAGVLVRVEAGAQIERPVRIVNFVTEGAEAHTRVLVSVEDNASAVVIEQSSGTQLSRSTAFAEYRVGESARLEHYRFALQTGGAMNAGGSHFELASKAELNSTLVGFGSQMSRVDVDVTHAGEHAFAKLNAIYLLDGKELFDLHSTIEHAAANGTTEENVRGIVADNSRAVFNGRIHIHRDAQKTLAELNNRNLLMSDRAEINTKPELEIYADDVRCAHGATIAEIDKKALYYMQSRGVSRAQAQIMLNFGFINELVDQMPNEILADWLRPQLRQRFANMEVK
jgi:Fe-S cluster assembly protein SufD